MADKITLIPQKKNANKHTPYGLRLLEKSVQQDGFLDAQTAAADGEIISGSARLELAAEKFAGVEPIFVHSDGSRPVVVIRDDIANAETARARRLSVAANKIAQVDFDPDFAILKEWAGEDEQIKKLFSDDEWREGTGEEAAPVNTGGISVSNQYGVIVICDDEAHQEQVYNSLTGQGYKTKVVVV